MQPSEFENVVKDPVLLEKFQDYLKEQNKLHNLEFYQRVKNLYSANDDEIQTKVAEIYSEFIEQEAPNLITLPTDIYDNITNSISMKDLNMNLFDLASSVVLERLQQELKNKQIQEKDELKNESNSPSVLPNNSPFTKQKSNNDSNSSDSPPSTPNSPQNNSTAGFLAAFNQEPKKTNNNNSNNINKPQETKNNPLNTRPDMIDRYELLNLTQPKGDSVVRLSIKGLQATMFKFGSSSKVGSVTTSIVNAKKAFLPPNLEYGLFLPIQKSGEELTLKNDFPLWWYSFFSRNVIFEFKAKNQAAKIVAKSEENKEEKKRTMDILIKFPEVQELNATNSGAVSHQLFRFDQNIPLSEVTNHVTNFISWNSLKKDDYRLCLHLRDKKMEFLDETKSLKDHQLLTMDVLELKRFKNFGITLLQGEELVTEIGIVGHLDHINQQQILGRLLITNYQIIFTKTDAFLSVLWTCPLATIAKIEKIGAKNQPEFGIEFICKDTRRISMALNRQLDNRKKLRTHLKRLCFPGIPQNLFAFKYLPQKQQNENLKKKVTSQGKVVDERESGIFNIYEEFMRQGLWAGMGADEGQKSETGENDLPPNLRWRVSDINFDYKFCLTYPSKFVVPSIISEEELEEVFNFRSRGRIPILCWYSSVSCAVIMRCSQPLVSIRKNRSKIDEKMVESIRLCSSASNHVVIVDARPKTNAIANISKGGGYELKEFYPNNNVEFLDIGNIHVMRDSQQKLSNLVFKSGIPGWNSSWLSSLESTGWFDHLQAIIQGAVRIVNLVHEQSTSVLLHCSDGWDRTVQLSSVALLILDPYYRTLDGFMLLIEKEWISVGHKFQDRIGHGMEQTNENSPIFLQFMDCVFQISQQFPCAFEFNTDFLIYIMDSIYNCKYSNFLFCSERERLLNALSQRTTSLWDYLKENQKKFKNVFYFQDLSVLAVDPNSENFVFWKQYYLRFHRSQSQAPPGMSIELRCEVYQAENENLKIQIEDLKKQISENKD